MKKLFIFALVVMLFAACATDAIDEQSVKVEEQAPDTLVGTFEGDDSRIQLNEVQKTVWTKDDLVSVFYRSNANQKWQYQGETGERTGNLKRVANAEGTQELSNIVVVYPYNENYYINPKTNNVQASLPAVQTYLKDSYGLDGNIMVSQSEYNQFSLKNVCGWLKIQLTGNGEKVRSIKLKGNNGEQVAGEIYINSADATSTLASEMGGADDGENSAGGNLVFDDTILTEVVLNCGGGVTLSSEATAFYIALPPQTFEKGLTIEILATDGSAMTKSTDKEIIINRNAIQPMAEFAYEGIEQTNVIRYISSTKIESESVICEVKISSHTWNAATGRGTITFDGDVLLISDKAFQNITGLKSVILPQKLAAIGAYAFQNCTSLESIAIPGSVEQIYPYAFMNCTNLSSIMINKGDNELNIRGGVFGGAPATLYLDRDISGMGWEYHFNNGPFSSAKISKIIIGSNVKNINDSAFCACTELQSLEFAPNSQLENIGPYAFCYSNINGVVVIPKTVTNIDYTAFINTTGITGFISYSNVYKEFNGGLIMGNTIFRHPAIAPQKDIWISSNQVSAIGEGAYYGCDIKSVTIITQYSDKPLEIGDLAFYKCQSLSEFKSFYSNHGMIISSIGDGVFNETAIKSLDFRDSTFETINGTFRGCGELETLYLPSTVSNIGDRTFEACNKLTEIYLLATTPPAIVETAFDVVAEGLKIYVPAESVYSYKSADGWSKYADNIVGYDFEKGEVVQSNNEIWYTSSDGAVVTPYSGYDNSYATALQTFGANIVSNTYENGMGVITFDAPVIRIGSSAFKNCTSLTSVTIPDSVTTAIGEYAFLNCTSLTSITIGKRVTSIGYEAFYCCTSLTSITIPDSVTSIGSHAFSGCTSLKEVYCKPTTPPSVWGYMFDYNAVGRKIYVPTESVEAYKSAQYWSDYASDIEGYDF